jgi:hypothetical protein
LFLGIRHKRKGSFYHIAGFYGVPASKLKCQCYKNTKDFCTGSYFLIGRMLPDLNILV